MQILYTVQRRTCASTSAANETTMTPTLISMTDTEAVDTLICIPKYEWMMVQSMNAQDALRVEPM